MNTPVWVSWFFKEVIMANSFSFDIEFAKEDKIQNKIDDLIFEIIKQRKLKKISQLELSKLVNVPQASISRIETFRTIPTLQMLLKIGNALNLDMCFKKKEG